MKGFLLSLCIIASVVANYVVTLTDSNFDSLVMAPNAGRWFVKVYTPWCGHCKKLAPIWEDIAETLDQEVKVGEIDATQQTRLAERFNIQGYPTLLLIENGFFKEYEGRREEQLLVDFARSGIKSINEAHEIPIMPYYMRDISQEVAEMASAYLVSHPLIACVIYLLVGILLGWLLTMLLIEIFVDSREVTDMDEVPSEESRDKEGEKEKAE